MAPPPTHIVHAVFLPVEFLGELNVARYGVHHEQVEGVLVGTHALQGVGQVPRFVIKVRVDLKRTVMMNQQHLSFVAQLDHMGAPKQMSNKWMLLCTGSDCILLTFAT